MDRSVAYAELLQAREIASRERARSRAHDILRPEVLRLRVLVTFGVQPISGILQGLGQELDQMFLVHCCYRPTSEAMPDA